ncbi:MAG TPA: hypothetical protein PK020_11535 [Ilumatobacteraceae bacterium]|nr:hypothetical protein [Ilumatobacteraceae bacterium]HRB02252.1 hypothetical protein [Ilumatobacteraceae bacterium]
MNTSDAEIRDALFTIAETIHSTPPPVHIITRAASRPPAHRRRVRWPVLLGAIGATLLVGAGVGAAAKLLSDDEAQLVNSARCRPDPSVDELVAQATATNGSKAEYWLMHSAGADGQLLILKHANGTEVGFGNCTALTLTNFQIAGSSDSAGTYVYVYGQLPPAAAAATVHLNDGTSILVQPNEHGYFLTILDRPASAMPDVITEVDFADASGTVFEQDTSP